MVVLQGMISIEQIDKAFDGKQVLQNVTLDIPDGQICGIFGKSGIGKSTLAKVLCGICPPDQLQQIEEVVLKVQTEWQEQE